MDYHFIAIILTALGVLASFWGITWKMSQYSDKKISKVYNRFDEYKDQFESKYVSKDVHQIVYENLQRKLDEVATDIKTLLRKNGFKE